MEAPTRTAEDRALEGARVLLAEDNEINQQIAVELLTGAGVDVVVAPNGRDAIERLTRGNERFDIVLMDIQMPEMDGYEAVRIIRADKRFTGLPIVAMTAHVLEQERKKIAAAGMNDHISKPIDPQAMFETLRRHYRSTRIRRAAAAAPAETATVPGIEGIDVHDGIRRVAGNGKLYLDLLKRYAEGQADAAERIINALKGGDRTLAERIAHTAKGVSGNIGAGGVQAVAAELEESIKRKDADDRTGEILSRFTSALSDVIAHIRPALSAAAGPPNDAPGGRRLDAREAREILQRLARYIEESDSEALVYLDSVRADLAATCPPGDVAELETAVRAFQFPAASAMLRKMSASREGSA